jgi:hypothetical protein
MRSLRMLIAVVGSAFLAASCASSGRSATTPAGSTQSRYVVTEAELATVGDLSAYDALQQLRPTFLRSRDPQTSSHPTSTPVAVFVGGGRTEGLDVLRSIRANTIKEMRFYEPQDANTRFGTGHNGGLIAVTLK